MSNKYEIPLSVLSMKDRKILKELFENARIPYSIIAKRVGLSKEVVNYRVKKLLEKGILRGFNTVFDVNTLGWQMYFVNIQLRNINNETEEEIIKHTTVHPNIAQVLKCIGKYDLTLKVFVKDNIEVNNLMKEFEGMFKTHIGEYAIDFIEQEFPVPLPFFYAPIEIKKIMGIPKKETKLFEASQIDLQILKALSHDARMRTTDIAKQLGISRELVRYHLTKLEKKVIVKYRPTAWSGSKAIGYSWYLVMLKIHESKRTKELESFIINHPNMTYFYRSIGEHDIQFEIRLKTSDELNQVLMDIRSILKDDLKSHELSIILREHKYTYWPKCMEYKG